MKLQVLSFTWKAFESLAVNSVTVTTVNWEITVLQNHMPLVSALKPSVLYIKFFDENNVEQREDYAIWWGIIEVWKDGVKVMADMLIDIDEVDRDQAEAAKESALKLMSELSNNSEKMDMEKFIQAEDILQKSIAQLKLYKLK